MNLAYDIGKAYLEYFLFRVVSYLFDERIWKELKEIKIPWFLFEGRLKGQLILIEILVSAFLSKNELENVNFCPSLTGQKVFVRFSGELKKPKRPFRN